MTNHKYQQKRAINLTLAEAHKKRATEYLEQLVQNRKIMHVWTPELREKYPTLGQLMEFAKTPEGKAITDERIRSFDEKKVMRELKQKAGMI
jgi:hypothetical protein